MITVISGTNRPQSLTATFAQHFQRELAKLTEEPVELVDLATLPHDFYRPDMYKADNMSPALREVQEAYVLPARKFAVISPEYNGSYPGALKVFIDALSIHRYPENFQDKPVALIGVATGRAGNLRGLDALSHIFLHMGGHLNLKKLPLSKADKLLDAEGNVTDATALASLSKLAQQLVEL